MDKHDDILFYIQIIVAVVAFTCGSMLIRKAFSFDNRIWLFGLVLLLSSAVLSYLGLHIPLYFLGGGDAVQYNLSIDIMMFGTGILFVVAIVGFAIDHMWERPTWLMVAAAAAFSVGIFPFLYRYQRDALNQQYEIRIVLPEDLPTPPAIL
jgi:hypothetical protein